MLAGNWYIYDSQLRQLLLHSENFCESQGAIAGGYVISDEVAAEPACANKGSACTFLYVNA